MKKVFALIGILFMFGWAAASADTLVLPASLTVVEEEAFMGDTSLDEVVLPEGIREIKADAFAGSSLSSIHLPASLESIADGALPAPGSVTVTAEEGTWAFDWAVEKGYIEGTVTEYTSVSSFEYEIESMECTITKYHGDDTVVIIPRTIEGVPVTKIGDYAFIEDPGLREYEWITNEYGEGVGIERVEIPSSIRSIGTGAFYACHELLEIVLPQSIVDIGPDAFAYCESLTSVSLPRGITAIKESTFQGCANLVSVHMGDNVTMIGNQAFTDCSNLIDIVIPNSVSSIGDCAFSGCTGLTCITIPESVERIGGSIFDGCISLTAIRVSPDNDAFCSSDGVLYDKSMKILVQYPSGKMDAMYSIPEGVTAIEQRAFCLCPYLQHIIIPDSMLSMQDYAFYDVNIRSMAVSGEVLGRLKSQGSYFIHNYDIPIEVYCRINASETDLQIPDCLNGVPMFKYSVDNDEATITNVSCGWADEIVIPDSIIGVPVVGIAENCFSNEMLCSIIIPNSVTFIGDSAFSECYGLKNVTLGNGIKSIGNCAFSSCSSLEEITIPDGVTVIETGTFKYCEDLHSVSLGQNTVEIGDEAFSGCTSLKSICIPASVEAIGYNCFDNCIALESIDVDPNNEHYRSDNGVLIGKYEYASSDSLFGNGFFSDVVLTYPYGKMDNVYFCNAANGVAPFAFRNCQYLREVYFTQESSWVKVAKDAFVNCNALERVEFAPNGFIMDVQNSALNNCPNLEVVSFADVNLYYSYNFDPFKNSGNPTVIVDPGQEKWCIRHGIAYIYAEENPDSDLEADIIQTQPSYGQIVEVGSEIQVSANVNGGIQPLEYNFALSVNGNAPVASGWISQNTYTFEASAKGSYNCFVVVRDSERNRCLSDAVFGTIGEPGQMVSGTLCAGDGWTIKWQITYDEDGQGNKIDAQLYIYLEGANASNGSLMLYSELDNVFLMPWLTDEYGFTKDMFTKISITGGNASPFEIVSDTFSGYVNVGLVDLKYVRIIQSHAFEGCGNLKQVNYDAKLVDIGAAAFKNCNKLIKFNGENHIIAIGDEAFENTLISSFTFEKTTMIGAKAFANTGLKRIVLWEQVSDIGEEAFDGCNDLTICCYYDSAAYNFAVSNGIGYELLDSIDQFLKNKTTKLDDSLLRITADLSLAAYTAGMSSDADVREYLRALGFNNLYSNYGGGGTMFNSGSLQFTIGTKTFNADENCNTDVLIVVAQGSKNIYELFQDMFTGNGSHRVNGYRTNDVVWDFYHDIMWGKESDGVNGIMDVIDLHKNYKVILTGHSLGGAAVNLVAAELTKTYFGRDNVYCYTFGAIDSIPAANPVSTGYENIHNVYNWSDTWSPNPEEFGSRLNSGVGSMNGKFGHIDLFDHDFRSESDKSKAAETQMIDAVNHAMHNYVAAVYGGEVTH